MENSWLTSKEAARYLGVSDTYFRRVILPKMVEMKIGGVSRLSNARNSAWRIKAEALDGYMDRMKEQ
jgi:excisionase family DNA binding protein